ncbi:DNA primase [Luteipulveratus halotolerans]|uniref:DNA primase n=1 Tax=Luteipulveratus halotolerans TaxID=1631356 RepID=A0A0L6CI02_9MICO|nr:DNA primase [Luteipulveratus halotolerans]KNX37422.1 DNA primase [Luteipulveratus halotolerans]
MPGRIKADDIALVKERASLEDVVREHVTLRPAGAGSLKGLCPFHDEKTPSFNIRPAVGAFHCFGCGEGGDVIEFVMKVEHLSFSEAVERLAGKAGIELHYEDGPRPKEESIGRRSRLVEAHRVAAEFFAAALVDSGEGAVARRFLHDRGFDRQAAEHFGVGYAPKGFDHLANHLRSKGFSADEIVIGGLAGRGQRGLLDRFRGRLIWPIRDITGDTIGFGARRLYDDDRIEAKYLNTSETPIYKKTHVLYGLDLAKKSIAKERRAVIVEGYTDVMACHLAGIDQAVATCGTSFGVDHIKTLRRIMRDEADQDSARVVFTFDGDAAGQAAAMKAFKEDQRWASQSFVAVAPGGQDPCDLRKSAGDAAVAHLIEDAVPMFEFAVRTTIARFDLDHAESRVRAMRAVAPIIAEIRDKALRPMYTRDVAGWLGVDVEQLSAEVTRAARAPKPDPAARRTAPESTPAAAEEVAPAYGHPDLRDPIVALERQLLQSLLQFPSAFASEDLKTIEPEGFSAPAHRAVYDGMITAGGLSPERSVAGWVDAVAEAVPSVVAPLVRELSVAPLPTRLNESSGRPDDRYLGSLVARVQEVGLNRQISDAMSTLRRLDGSDADRARAVSHELQALQVRLAELRAAMT